MDGVNQKGSVDAVNIMNAMTGESAGVVERSVPSGRLRVECLGSTVPGGRRQSLAVAGVAVLAAMTLIACAGGNSDDDASTSATDATPGESSSGVGSPASDQGDSAATRASDAVSSFVTVATAAGWTCIPGADPFTGKPGATCSPEPEEAMTSAVFAVFDRADVSDGMEAVRLARQTTAGQIGGINDVEGAQEGTAGDLFADQYLPLDSSQLSGYCVNTLGTCGGTDFAGLGLVLGG